MVFNAKKSHLMIWGILILHVHTHDAHSVEWQCANGLCRAVTMRKENLRGRGPWQRRQKRPRSTGEGPFLFYWLNGLWNTQAEETRKAIVTKRELWLVTLRYSLVSLTGHLYVVRVERPRVHVATGISCSLRDYGPERSRLLLCPAGPVSIVYTWMTFALWDTPLCGTGSSKYENRVWSDAFPRVDCPNVFNHECKTMPACNGNVQRYLLLFIPTTMLESTPEHTDN